MVTVRRFLSIVADGFAFVVLVLIVVDRRRNLAMLLTLLALAVAWVAGARFRQR